MFSRGTDGAVMEVYQTLLCIALLCMCASCNWEEADSGLSTDQASRLRRMWLLAMKDSKLRDGASHSHPVRGHNTHQLLYCHSGIGYHLQILTNGSIGGVHEPNEHSRLRIFAMKRGVVGIHGVKSGLYLCMNREGIAQGMKDFSPDCLFKENLEENHYTTYSSATHPGLYLALSSRGHVKRGNKVNPHQTCTHFLPRKAPTH